MSNANNKESLNLFCNPEAEWVLDRAKIYWRGEVNAASPKFFQSPAIFTACYGVTTSGDTLGTQVKFEAASKVYLNTVVPGYLKWLDEEATALSQDSLA